MQILNKDFSQIDELCEKKRQCQMDAQVRVSGWRSFTKTFAKKSDAVLWSNGYIIALRLYQQIKLITQFGEVFTSDMQLEPC